MNCEICGAPMVEKQSLAGAYTDCSVGLKSPKHRARIMDLQKSIAQDIAETKERASKDALAYQLSELIEEYLNTLDVVVTGFDIKGFAQWLKECK